MDDGYDFIVIVLLNNFNMLYRYVEGLIQDNSHGFYVVGKMKNVLMCFIVHYVVTILSIFVMLLVDYLIVNFFEFNSILSSHIRDVDTLEYYGYYYGLFIICIGAPILEEVCFRLFLSVKKLHISISLAALYYYLSGPVWRVDDEYDLLIRIFGAVFIFALTFKYWKDKWSNCISRYRLIIYSSVFFGLIHVYNFNPIQYSIFFLYIFYVIPQISIGVMLSVLRLRFGFFWAFLLHFMVNTSSVFKYLHFN